MGASSGLGFTVAGHPIVDLKARRILEVVRASGEDGGDTTALAQSVF